MTFEQKIGQLFTIGIPGPAVDDTTRELLKRVLPGGVCLFARNIRERNQTRDLLDQIREILPVEPMLSVDQEGGLVDRLRRVMTPMPAAEKIRTTEEAAEFGTIIAETLRIFGFNTDFAPVVDILDGDRARFSNGIQSRAFPGNENDVTELASSFLNALQAGGIVGCLKHFPGLGASEVDSHRELPRVSISEDELSTKDLHPYRSMLEADSVRAVMVAHAAYPNTRLQEQDQNGKLLPSSLSPAIISKLLRGELEYDGLVLTDDLEMGAIVENYGIGDACVMAINAGADMLAICAGIDAIYEGHDAVSRAVESGTISEQRIQESIDRITAVRNSFESPLPFDNDRLDALSDRIAEFASRLK